MNELTDDLGLSPEFLADEDIARDVDEYDSWHEGPRCGGPWRETPWGWEGGCPGCRHCDPVDSELKPYGFGIERFEDPALAEANRRAHERLGLQYGAYSLHWWQNGGTWSAFKPGRDAEWARASRQSLRRLRHSDIVWGRLCDECETHSEAARRYKQWALRAVTVRYRDE